MRWPLPALGTALALALAPITGVSGERDAAAHQLLMDMSEASSKLNYTGEFLLRDGDTLDTFKVVHSVSDQGVHEKVVSLGGTHREFHRHDDRVTCLLPEHGLRLEGLSRARSPLPGPLPGTAAELEQLERSYDLRVLDVGRVAGRECRVVGITPRDELRYGKELCVDRQTGLLLSSRKFEGSGDQRRELMSAQFVHVSFHDSIDPGKLEPEVNTGDLREYRHPVPDESTLDDESAGDYWKVDPAPAGFELVSRRVLEPDDKSQAHEYLVYSDGLVSVSLFVEKMKDADKAMRGRSRHHAVNVYSDVHGEHQVTAVGEVPVITLSRFVEAARSVRSGSDD